MGSMTQALKNMSGAEADERAQKERLELLLVAAKAKIRAYRDEINESFMNPAIVDKIQIPGIRAIRYIEQYHIATKQGFSDTVKDHLKKAVNAFFSIGGKDQDTKSAIQTGIESLIYAGLDGFIGSTQAGESEQKIYIVVPENNAFIRVDIVCWKYNFEQNRIINQNDTAVAYVLCKSVIDHTKLTIDELIYFVSEALNKREQINPEGKWIDVPVFDNAKLKTNPPFPSTEPSEEVTYNIVTEKKYIKVNDKGEILKENDQVFSLDSKLLINDNPNTEKSFKDILNDSLSFKEIQKLNTQPNKLNSFKTILPSIDISGDTSNNSPPSIQVVEAYIEEIIRVWKKLKEERGG